MSQPVVVATNAAVEGNITSCKIEQQLFKVERSSSLSFSERNTYISYDVCNKQILETYSVPSFTGFGFVASFILFFLISLVIGAVVIGISNKY